MFLTRFLNIFHLCRVRNKKIKWWWQKISSLILSLDRLSTYLKPYKSYSHQNQNSKQSVCWWNTALHRRLYRWATAGRSLSCISGWRWGWIIAEVPLAACDVTIFNIHHWYPSKYISQHAAQITLHWVTIWHYGTIEDVHFDVTNWKRCV